MTSIDFLAGTNTNGFDPEAHEMPVTDGVLYHEYAVLINVIAGAYDNEADYKLHGPNCASFVNAILKITGMTDRDRNEFGEFFGIDWGEEDLIDLMHFKSYFDSPQK